MSHIDIEQAAAMAATNGWTCTETAIDTRTFTRDAAEVRIWHGPKGRVSCTELVRDSNGDRAWHSYYGSGMSNVVTQILRSGNKLAGGR